LQPCEVGLLHIPLIARTPTLPGKGNAVGITIEPTSPYPYNLTRPPDGGRLPTQLALSAIRLQILRDIGFMATKVKPGLLAAGFDLMPGDPDAFRDDAVLPRYETLWTTHELPQEQARYAALAEKAEVIAKGFNRKTVLEPLIALSEQRFALAGLALHPGEALFIGKLLAYVMEDGLDLEEGLSRKEGRWFTTLATSNQNAAVEIPVLLERLYNAIVYDAVRVGLQMVSRALRQDPSDLERLTVYADEIAAALEGRTPINLGLAYLPLVLAGIMLNGQIGQAHENPWTSLAQIKEATQFRMQQAGSEYGTVFRMLDVILQEAERFLIRKNAPRS
jgi:hypothetical protein